MYLGYDYPRYRYPSYAPWCTPAGVAAEVQYIPQPREVPQAIEAIYHSALPSTAGTIPVAVATSITLVSKPWGTPRLLLSLLGASLPAQPLTHRSGDRVLCSRSRRLQRSIRHAPCLLLRVFAYRVARYRMLVAWLTAGMFRTSRPLVTLVRRSVATTSRSLRQLPARPCPVSARTADRPPDLRRPFVARGTRHAFCRTYHVRQNGSRSAGSPAWARHRRIVVLTATENPCRVLPLFRTDQRRAELRQSLAVLAVYAAHDRFGF